MTLRVSFMGALQARHKEIAEMEMIDTGKPIWEAVADINGCADVLEYYGGIAASIKGTFYSYTRDLDQTIVVCLLVISKVALGQLATVCMHGFHHLVHHLGLCFVSMAVEMAVALVYIFIY